MRFNATSLAKALGMVALSAGLLAVTPVLVGAAAEVPGSPTNVTATAGPQQATVSWVAPVQTPGAPPISSYTATAAPGGAQCTASTTACVVNGLAPNTVYSFTVAAINSAGSSAPSSASNSVTPTASTTTTAPVTTTTGAIKPGTPTGVAAVAGKNEATITWNAPMDGSAVAITQYRATATPGGASCTATGATGHAPTTCVVTGLTGNTPYTFQVVAFTQGAQSAPSVASNSVTPTGGTPASSSKMWIYIVLIIVVLVLIVVGVITLMASKKRREADDAWTPGARAAFETATLARSLVLAQPTGGDAQLPQVRAQAEDAAVALDRVASRAPDEERRQAASSIAEGLRGVVFSLEAESLLRTNATPPTAAQLAEADLARRRRGGELDAALAQFDQITRPPVR